MSDHRLLTLNDIRTLLESLERGPRKALGQNFVVEPQTIRLIVRVAGIGPHDHAVEIGPGLGSLTLGLLEAGARVTAVEMDPQLAEDLTRRISNDDRLVVVCADALSVDWDQLLGDEPATVVANLPYNVATTIVLDVLARAPQVGSLTVMVQSEVADRMVAIPGTKAYGLPSVLIALYGQAVRRQSIGPEVFYPRPRVESALVTITRHNSPIEIQPGLIELIRMGFSQRRKMLRGVLGGHINPGVVEAALVAIDVRPDARAELLNMNDWVAFGQQLDEHLDVFR